MLIVLKQRIIIQKSSEQCLDAKYYRDIQSWNPLFPSVFWLAQ